MGRMAGLLGDSATAAAAAARGVKIEGNVEGEYFRGGKYAFSRNADGSVDAADTLYPAIAWWNGGAGLKQAGGSFRGWDSHRFSTDWGTRDVAEDDPLYQPISYHMGSVWPLFTGWEAMADYRTGRWLAGYQHLMENADLTTAQDLGAVTELLSGAYFVPFGRSTSHQLWSSAMVITPVLRGMFGVTVDGLGHTVTVEPRLPADWGSAEVNGLRVGDSVCSLRYTRIGWGDAGRSYDGFGAGSTACGGDYGVAEGGGDGGAWAASPGVQDDADEGALAGVGGEVADAGA